MLISQRNLHFLLSCFLTHCTLTAICSAQWTQVGLSNYEIVSLYVNGDTILAGSYGGRIFRSTNGGVVWTPTTTNMPISNRALSFTQTTDVFYAAVGYGIIGSCDTCGGVYRSFDHALTWQRMNSGLPPGPQVQEILAFGNRLFAATDYGLYVSHDLNTWELIDTTIPAFTSVLSIQRRGLELFIGTEWEGVFASTNGGDYWFRQSHGLPKVPSDTSLFRSVSSLTILGSTLIAAVEAGVYKLSDANNRWVPINTGITNQYLSALSVGRNTLFASTTGPFPRVMYFRSTDSTWRDYSNGLNFGDRTYITSLAANDSFLFLGVGGIVNGVWRRPLSDLVAVADQRTPPEKTTLEQNFPNPFNPSTTIRFHLERSGFVSLKILDLLGREILLAEQGVLSPGTYERRISIENLSTGVYFYQLETNGIRLTRKLLLAK